MTAAPFSLKAGVTQQFDPGQQQRLLARQRSKVLRKRDLLGLQQRAVQREHAALNAKQRAARGKAGERQRVTRGQPVTDHLSRRDGTHRRGIAAARQEQCVTAQRVCNLERRRIAQRQPCPAPLGGFADFRKRNDRNSEMCAQCARLRAKKRNFQL